tara:strand:- start:17259 stop:17546 length:288 start_codon:yes stop_codon:yes gene_type:complete
MGMSTSIRGFVSPDNETYKKHSKVLRACIDADIEELPKETAEYFGTKYPEEYLFEDKLEVSVPMYDYNEDMTQGYEIKLSEIPEGVETIRFTNSW